MGTQALEKHACPCGQICPQPPQLAEFEVVFVHTPEHTVAPAGHEGEHSPP